MHIIKFRQNQWSRNPDGSLYQQICQLAQCTHILRQKLSGVPTITLCPLSFHATTFVYILQFHSLTAILYVLFLIFKTEARIIPFQEESNHIEYLYTLGMNLFLHLIFKIWVTDIWWYVISLLVICHVFLS